MKDTLTDEQINDLIVTAIEGGINYWCWQVSLKEGTIKPEQQSKLRYLSDCISLGGTLILHDAESSESWELTKEKFLKGIEKTLEWGGSANVQDLFDNHDADVADVLIQFSIFDKIVFG